MEREYVCARGAAVPSIANFIDSCANRMFSLPHVLTLLLHNQIRYLDISMIQGYG